MSLLSTSLLTITSTSRSGCWSPPLPLLGCPALLLPWPGSPGCRLCGGMYRFLSASARLAVSDAINTWAVESSEESVVDGILFVSITPGMNLLLLLRTLASSCTLSIMSLVATYCRSVHRFSWLIFNAMSLTVFCNTTLFDCSSLPCSSFNRCFLCALVMKGQKRATVQSGSMGLRHAKTALLM